MKKLRELGEMQASAGAVNLMSFVSSWLLTLSLGLVILGGSDPRSSEELAAVGGFQIALTCIAIILCLPIVVRLGIRRDSRIIALWQVIGASPRRTRTRYSCLIAASTIIGSILGGGFGYITWPIFSSLVLDAELPDLLGLHDPLVFWAWIFGPVTAVVVGIIAVLFGSSRLVRIEPVRAVRENPAAEGKISRVRLSFLVIATFGLAIGYLAIGNTAPLNDTEAEGGLVSAYWGAALGLLLIVGIADRIIVFPVLRLLTVVAPSRLSISWFIASTTALRRITASSSVVTPLVVGAGSVGAIFGMVAQVEDIASVSVPGGANSISVSPAGQILLVFGAPVLISAAAAVAVVFLTGRWRMRDVALLQVLGATKRQIVGGAALECVLYCLTATVIVTSVLGVNTIAMGVALNAGPIPGVSIVWFGYETYWLLGVGFITIAAAIIFPTIDYANRPSVTTIEA